MNLLEINKISLKYNTFEVLKDINFFVNSGDITAIIGESGCGKTTLLKAIQGLLDLSKGEIIFNGKKILGPKDVLVPGVEGIATVFQDFKLQKGLSVFNNIKHHINHLKLADQYTFTQELIDLCGMNEFKDKKPGNISGGQKQKAALAMALIAEPELILLDEPFSHLDQISKEEFIRVIQKVNKELGIAFIFVTHNADEALRLSDNLVVIKAGKQIKMVKTADVFDELDQVYIAKLLGVKNIISGSLLSKIVNDLPKSYHYHVSNGAISVSSNPKGNWQIKSIPVSFLYAYQLIHSKTGLVLDYFAVDAPINTDNKVEVVINREGLIKFAN